MGVKRESIFKAPEKISVGENSAKWSCPERWIWKLCEDGRMDDVLRCGRSQRLPKDAEKPGDLRGREVHPFYTSTRKKGKRFKLYV